jgi:hypothetical protein
MLQARKQSHRTNVRAHNIQLRRRKHPSVSSRNAAFYITNTFTRKYMHNLKRNMPLAISIAALAKSTQAATAGCLALAFAVAGGGSVTKPRKPRTTGFANGC